MFRRVFHFLLAVSLLIAAGSLIAWPVSFYVFVRVAHVGTVWSGVGSVAGGGVHLVLQHGEGNRNFLASNVPPLRGWYIAAGRNHTHYLNSHQDWKDTMSFSHSTMRYPWRKGGPLILQDFVTIPLWFICWLFAVPPAIAYVRWRRRRHRILNGLCLRCGYDLRASSDRCPECGTKRCPDRTGQSPLMNHSKEASMQLMSFLAALLCTALLVHAEVKTQTVEYKDGQTTLKGFLAYDDAIQGKRPGIVVVPEWWGMTDYPKSRAKQLAGLGYVAFVADIYGDGFATDDPKVPGQKSGEAKKNDWCRTRGKLALKQLVKNEHVDPGNLAAIGYCFGGGCVIEMARAGDDLRGVVSFHGTLDTKQPAQPGEVKSKMLVLTGADDPFVTKDKVEAFEKEMKSAGVDYKVVTYPGAKHAFTNPSADKYGISGIQYNKQADEKSWQAMKDFFAKIFGSANPG